MIEPANFWENRMQTRYKLTDSKMMTYGGTLWTIGEWKETSGEGDLCSDGWLHCYCDPLIAVMLNPIHGNINAPKIFAVEVGGETKAEGQLKEGWTRMRLAQELELPAVTTEQRARFAILCAYEVCEDVGWRRWANAWLSVEDRSQRAALSASEAVVEPRRPSLLFKLESNAVCPEPSSKVQWATGPPRL